MKTTCGLCGYLPKVGEWLHSHIEKKHPELRIGRRRDAGGHRRPICTICNKQLQSLSHPAHLKEHLHSEIQQNEARGIIGRTPTISQLDKLIEQVNQNVNMVQTIKGERQVLEQKLMEYATKIVELQNIIATSK